MVRLKVKQLLSSGEIIARWDYLLYTDITSPGFGDQGSIIIIASIYLTGRNIPFIKGSDAYPSVLAD